MWIFADLVDTPKIPRGRIDGKGRSKKHPGAGKRPE